MMGTGQNLTRGRAAMRYAMNEQERNELAWRAFLLGMQTALNAHGISCYGENFDKIIRLFGEIARGETTLHDPTHTARNAGPATEVVVGIGNTAITGDRELAAWIIAGLDRATSVPEDDVG
jgi:hypothetical protein